ncbi:MAG: sulfotransferase family protein [Candidatus Nitrospinota bacterium M3_3B_026]
MKNAHQESARPNIEELAASVHRDLEKISTAPPPSKGGRGDEALKSPEDFDRLCSAIAYEGMENPVAPDGAASALAERPVFIGGGHKTGTTLLRNLLDGHSVLFTLPLDGAGYDWATNALRRGEGFERLRNMTKTLLTQLIMPNLGQRPSWVLSGGEPRVGPYIDLIRALAWLVREQEAGTKSVMVGVANALWQVMGEGADPRQKKYMVEKSTHNIFDTTALVELFPDARFIHIIRRPEAVVASQKRRQGMKGRWFDIQREVDLLDAAMRAARENLRRLGPDVYHVVYYERLVGETRREMKSICEFLEIDYEDSLVSPTINGLPASANTGHPDRAPGAGEVGRNTVDYWRKRLTPEEITFIQSALAGEMEKMGYDVSHSAFSDYMSSLMRLRRAYENSDSFVTPGLVRGMAWKLRKSLPRGAGG